MAIGVYSRRNTVQIYMLTVILLILMSLEMSTCAALIKLKDDIEYNSYEVLPSDIK